MIESIDRLVQRFRNTSVHTPRIALVRFMLAFGMLLTLCSNDMSVIANHHYARLPDYQVRRAAHSFIPFKKADLFMIMAPASAKVVVIIILLLVMSGFLPQVTGLLHFWACFSVHNYFMVLNGGDGLALVLSLLLLPVCLTDARINQWKRKPTAPSARNIIGNVALVAIHIQAAALYFDACVAKLFVAEWRNGTAVYYYTSHYRLGAPDWLRHINEWVTLSPAVRIITWGTLLLELVLCMCLFFPAWLRRKLLLPALIFHGLIAINFGLVTFLIAISALLILYLYDDRVVSSPKIDS